MTFQVVDNNQNPIDAHYDIEGDCLVFYARKGSKNAGGLNTDYGKALRLLLSRIVRANLRIEDAWVDSNRVQHLPISDRRIIDPLSIPSDSDALFTEFSRRMAVVGRQPNVKISGGNPTKRIRIKITSDSSSGYDLEQILGGRKVSKDLRSIERLPSSELYKVEPDHIWRAVEKLLEGFTDRHYGSSTDYDLITDNGFRLPPKAVFGLAATEALGFEVRPKHFTGGIDSTCFRILRQSGFRIIKKTDEGPTDSLDQAPILPDDRQWTEGRPRLVKHLKRERGSGLSQAKKAAFQRAHEGRLFCERCHLDPIEAYGGKYGEACIEVHHHNVAVEDMADGHKTTLEDLQCLCANCHRVVHHLLKEAAKEVVRS